MIYIHHLTIPSILYRLINNLYNQVFCITNCRKSKPPVKRAVCSCPIRAYYRYAPQGAAFTSFKLPSLPPLLPLKGRLYYLLPLKGSSYSLTLSLSNAISCFSWSSIYFLTVASFNPTVLT